MTTYTVLDEGSSDVSDTVFTITDAMLARDPNPNKALFLMLGWAASSSARNVLPASVSGRGLGFTGRNAKIDTYMSIGIWTAPSGSSPATSGDISMTWAANIDSITWQLLEADDLDPSDIEIQRFEWTWVDGTSAPAQAFPSDIASSDSSVLILGQVNSDTVDLTAGTGLTAIGTKQAALTPNQSLRSFYKATAQQTVGYGTSPTNTVSRKNLIGLEVRKLATSNTPPVVTATRDKASANASEVVTLTATATDSDGTIASRTWEQVEQAGVPSVDLSGTGLVATFTVPAVQTNKTATFRFTAVDDDGAGSTADVTVQFNRHKTWFKKGTSLIPRYPHGRHDGPDDGGDVFISLLASAESSSITLNYATAPNGRSVAGVYIGRNGPNTVNGNIGYETGLVTALSGAFTFNNLVSDTDYTIYVEPVVDGIRRPDMRRSATITTLSSDPGNPDDDDLDGWNLRYSTIFDEPSLTAAGWTLETGPASNMNSYDRPQNCLTQQRSGSGLTILGKRESGFSRPYTCGDMKGEASHLVVPNYFRAEVIGRTDDAIGVWPCLLWFRPANGSDGEIDVMEYMGGLFSGTQRRVAVTMHKDYANPDPWKGPIMWNQLTNPSITATHKYTIEKTPGTMKVWMDDDTHLTRYFGNSQEVIDHLPQNGITTPKAWWNQYMENAARTWYPRINLQIGDGTVNGGKFVVPEPESGWTESQMEVDSLKFWTMA